MISYSPAASSPKAGRLPRNQWILFPTGKSNSLKSPNRAVQRACRCLVKQGDSTSQLVDTLSQMHSSMEVLELLESHSIDNLVNMADLTRQKLSKPELVSFSPKVFLPITRLCRDTCSYCTFVTAPQEGRRSYMSIDEILDVAYLGASQGCTEALLTLGDKPELKYPCAQEELLSLGYSTTVEYVQACAAAILEQTNLIPHINAGLMTESEMKKLRTVSGSMGLMLESTSTKLMDSGMPHHKCPDKDPEKRLEMIEIAGKLKIPFTTGLLVGIGDERLDRIDGLLKIRDLHQEYGHIQEIIIQNFVPKKNTPMNNDDEVCLDEMLFIISACRLLMPKQNIQVPPNLSLDWKSLMRAGINDFGGISPGVTPDFVNPERAWPSIVELSKSVAEMNRILIPRLPIYPEYIDDYDKCQRWLSSERWPTSPLRSVLSQIDAMGYVRETTWYAGAKADIPKRNLESASVKMTEIASKVEHASLGQISAIPKMKLLRHGTSILIDESGCVHGSFRPKGRIQKAELIEKSLKGGEFSLKEIVQMFKARGKEFETILAAADHVRREMNGDDVSYVINRNINYTNICEYGCKFCAFSKGSKDEDLRGSPYLLSETEICKRTQEAVQVGATEVCMQGGIHPSFTGDDYLNILGAAKLACPDIHVHAFSPLEICHGASTLGISISEFLNMLRDAGLGSLPGTAAEVLVDTVRQNLCPDKLNTQEWVDVIMTAHNIGLPTTSTIMFGHVDSYHDWATHLLILKNIQKGTSGITEFVPLPFVHMEAPMFRTGKSRTGPTLRESILMHSVARLVLNPHITNIQASWVKMGPSKASELLLAGCNDMGGTLLNESITRAAGAQHGQLVSRDDMERLIHSVGRHPYQRTTLYSRV